MTMNIQKFEIERRLEDLGKSKMDVYRALLSWMYVTRNNVFVAINTNFETRKIKKVRRQVMNQLLVWEHEQAEKIVEKRKEGIKK